MSTAPPSTIPAYPDRSTRLIVLGIVQILLGCLCGLLAVLMVAVNSLGQMAKPPHAQPMTTAAMIQVMVIYLSLAVTLIWLGIGLARARRWAWTLTVLLSWIWLIIGAIASVTVVFFMGKAFEGVAQQGKLPPGALMAMRITAGSVVAFIYILLPAVFLLLCQHESVRATCRRKDPKIRWTDRCPMPVLALSILLAWSIVSMSTLVAYRCAVPLFGVIISGAAGAVAILLIALVLAWGTYRLQRTAWWGTLLLGIVGTVNTVVTFSRIDLMKFYETMGMPADQLEMIRKMGIAEFMSHGGLWLAIAGGAAWVGYLLYLRRYFVRSGKAMNATS
jgi:hypothetical protein